MNSIMVIKKKMIDSPAFEEEMINTVKELKG